MVRNIRPGRMKTKTGNTLMQPQNKRAGAGVVFVLRTQDTLNDGLVGAPIPDAQRRVAEEHRIPGRPGSSVGERSMDSLMVSPLACS